MSNGRCGAFLLKARPGLSAITFLPETDEHHVEQGPAMIPLAPLGIVQWKEAFRKRAKASRAEAAERQPSAARHAASQFMLSLEIPEQSAVALYHAKGDELDTEPLAKALAERGISVLLPVVVGKKKPLVFRLVEIDRELEEGPYGIMQPPADAPEHRPDFIVTPLLGVRRDGARLGMGGGYYDRTLEALRREGPVTAIGYGYAAQMMERFPVGPEDQFLDAFVSEQGFQRFPPRER